MPGQLQPSHLHRKHDFPARTFDWSNLFLSCNSRNHCGHYKDKSGGPTYNPANLIHPDVDEPDQYIQFFQSGDVKPRSGLPPALQVKAQTTIDTLNLNHSTLKEKRRASVEGARSLVFHDIDFFESLPESDRNEWLVAEIESFRGRAHATVARHFFTHLE